MELVCLLKVTFWEVKDELNLPKSVVQKTKMQDMPTTKQAGKKITLPSKSEDPFPKVRDIVDANAYTIEEAKQKEEQDTLLAIAESKRRRVKDFIENIRSQFEAIISENCKLPEAEQIPRELFEIDTGNFNTNSYLLIVLVSTNLPSAHL